MLHFCKKLPFFSSARRGKQAFLAAYKDDHIFPVAPHERNQMPDYSKCLTCRLCDTVCPDFDAQDSLSSPSYLVMGYSRSLVDFRHLGKLPFDCTDCQSCEDTCPENVPVKQIISFVESHAA